MTIGTIIEIQESWPLGLRIRDEEDGEEVLVDVAEDCAITSGKKGLEPGDLRTGMRVRIRGRQPVTRIEVLHVM